MVSKLNGINTMLTTTQVEADNGNQTTTEKTEFQDTSLFLEESLKKAEDKQGFIGKTWNSVKETFDFGTTEKDCEDAIEKYKNGEISYEEAEKEIDDYTTKQDETTELISNITTGVAAIATTVAIAGSGPVGWGLLAVGALVGAGTKVGINMLDRGTNNVDNDVLDGKQIAKDAISGAVTGATSASASGVKAGIEAGDIALSVANGAKSGAICGGAGGAASYTLNTLTDDDKEFKFGDLVKSTATSAFVSGTVGGVVGAGMYGIAASTSGVGAATSQSLLSTSSKIAQDSTASSTRKILGQAERDVIAA